MKSRIKYTDEPMGKLKVIKDFLPSPDKLVLKEENVKVTDTVKSFLQILSKGLFSMVFMVPN